MIVIDNQISFKGQFQYKKDWNKTASPVMVAEMQLQRPIPVQKGLKHHCPPRPRCRQPQLQRPIPVQKGLKHGTNSPTISSIRASKANSSTKRIETTLSLLRSLRYQIFKGQFQYKKDWNLRDRLRVVVHRYSSKANSSTKRIETWCASVLWKVMLSSKANSSTKRIETTCHGHYPAKNKKTSKANSSTKRIETCHTLRDQICVWKLQRPIPVQKGLKHDKRSIKGRRDRSSKANSSTKRIETWSFPYNNGRLALLQRPIPVQKGLKRVKCRLHVK